MKSKLLLHTVALVLATGGSAALAEAPGGQANRLGLLDEVQVTATRRAESIFDVPAATTVIDTGRIREAAAQTAMDLLHGEAGTFVQQTTPGQAIVIVRGLKGSEVLHLVDGFRLNNAFFRNAPNQYMALVDGQALDRIEVVRGPSSALYGGDAMGGVVQMFTAEPRFDGSDWSAYRRLRAQYASADRSMLSRVEGAAGRDGLALSGGVTYQDVDELRTGDGMRRPFTAYTAKAANAKVSLEFADSHELMLQAQWLEQPSTPRVDELVPGFGQTRPNSIEFAFEPQVRRLAHGRYRYHSETPLWDVFEAQLGRQTIVDDRRSLEFGSVNRELEANASRLDGLVLQASKAFGNHYLSYGGEFYADTIRSERRRENADTGAISARPPRFPDRSTMDQLGVFVADDWSPGRFDVNSSLRYSRVATHLSQLGGFAVDVEYDDLSAAVGVGYALSDEWKLVANLGRAFRPANVFDLGTFGDRPGNRFSIPNQQLQPERIVTLDVGIKHASDLWTATAFVFVSRYQDKIMPVLTGDTTQSGRLVVQSRNATRLDLAGLEAELRGTLREDVGVYATATFTHGNERLEGNDYAADRIPPLYGKMGALWRVNERFTLEGYAHYATRQDRLSPRDVVDPRIDPQGTGGWVSWNARVGYRASDDIDASLRLENLGDHAYREHGSGLEEPGFNAVVTLDWRL